MRKRLVWGIAAVVATTGAVGIGSARSISGQPSGPAYGLGTHPKEAVYEHESGGVGEASRASSEQVENRAFPRGYVESARALTARRAYLGKPTKLSRADFRSPAAASAASPILSSWQELGPVTPKVPAEVTYTGVATLNSGRVTAMAIDPNCGQPHKGCRLWVAAAGGGVWRTPDALTATPTWTSASTGLESMSTGSLIVDPTDPTGDSLYLGTGEPNGSADSEAGVGLYKTVDGGDSWTLVSGSRAVSHDRSIGAIAIDPANENHIYIGTDVARRGHSSTYGGRRTPPGAPPVGLYESTNGGATFQLAFSRPGSPLDPAAGTGSDFFQGGVNRIELDPNDPATVYAALFGYGIWRRSAAQDTDGAFHQVFVTRNPADTFGGRTEFALAALADDHTRIYAGDSSDDEGVSELWRTDRADRPAAELASATANLAPWRKLSNPTNGTPGFTSYNYCQDQCGYDDPVVVDPSNPDTVWLGGQMAYGEIPGAEGGIPRSFGRAVVRSTDAGVTFADMTQDSGNEGLHPDNHFIVMDPYNPAWAFIGSDGGVARIRGAYTDRSAECDGRKLSAPDLEDCRRFLAATPVAIDAINDGLATLQFQDVTFNPSNALGNIMGGTQDNGTWTGPANWMESIGGDGGPSAIGLDGVRQHTYTGTTGDVNFHGTDPRTWDYNTEPMDVSGEASAFYSPLIADPVVPDTLFAGMQHVWRTPDNGGDQAQLDEHCRDLNPLSNLPIGDRSQVCGDWLPIGPDLTAAPGTRTGQYLSQLQRAPSDRGTLWASTRMGRVFVSSNADSAVPAGVTFDRIDTSSTPGRFPSGIAVDPANAQHAWISYSGYNAYTPSTPGHVFEVTYNPATHRGTFVDRSYDLGDQPITDVAFDPPTGDLYAASDFGVLRLPSGATAWEKVSANLPPVAVYGLTLAADARTLYAATHGRGIYELALPAAPKAVISGPDAALQGTSATYSGTGSSSYSGGPLTFDWTLPNGAHSANPTVTVGFPLAGGAVIALTVADADGRTATATKFVVVIPHLLASGSPAPQAAAPAPKTAARGGRLSISRLVASLRGRHVRVRFRVSGAGSVMVRVRDAGGRMLASRTLRATGARTFTVTLALKRGTKIAKGQRIRVQVRAGAAAVKEVRLRG